MIQNVSIQSRYNILVASFCNARACFVGATAQAFHRYRGNILNVHACIATLHATKLKDIKICKQILKYRKDLLFKLQYINEIEYIL